MSDELNQLLELHEEECIIHQGSLILSINLNYRDITRIGRINQKFWNVMELYLNHNNISSLNGIQQFINLKVLSLKFNLISKMEDILMIPNKSKLQHLNVKGNPVEKLSSCTITNLHPYFCK